MFYVISIVIAMLGDVDQVHLICAWMFAGLRIAHSLVQATINLVMARFTLFSLSWMVLGFMVIREALIIFVF